MPRGCVTELPPSAGYLSRTGSNCGTTSLKTSPEVLEDVDAKVQGADRNSLVDAVKQRGEIEVVGQEHRGEAVPHTRTSGISTTSFLDR
jgi:hypothetical protein